MGSSMKKYKAKPLNSIGDNEYKWDLSGLSESITASQISNIDKIYDDIMISKYNTDSNDKVKKSTNKNLNVLSEIKEDKERSVVASDGKRYSISECVYIDGIYFHKSDKNIVEDLTDGDLIHISHAIPITVKLIIENNKVITNEVLFTRHQNINKFIPVYSNKYEFNLRILSLDCIQGWDYIENYTTGAYCDADIKQLSINEIKGYEVFKNGFSNDLDLKTSLAIGKVSPSYICTEGLKYTFGVEIEVARGYIPTWKAHKLYNILCVRDGSVNPGEEAGGAEYVTGIMTGDTGINHLQDICIELSKRTRVNKSAGVHIHLGNIDFSKKFLINSYRLALLIENELFMTLPPSRRNNVYCKTLFPFEFKKAIGDTQENIIEIEEMYNALFKYISYEKINNPNFEYNKSKQHPLGAKCQYNRDTPRYCWINYVPAMFNTRNNNSYSLEIRSMNGSTNFTKIKNWLLFFMAFMAFADRYPELIDKGITMNDIINKILPKNSKELISYFNNRKLLFQDQNSEANEYKEETVDKKKSIKELINN